MRTFFDRDGINYCDAKLLGAYWGMDVTRAKVEGGQKILASGNQGISNVKAALQASRGARNKCVWGDTTLLVQLCSELGLPTAAVSRSV